MENKLKDFGLELRESDNPDRQLIDFDICDEQDNVAWIWGDSLDDVEVECTHPYQCIEWGDEDEQGECKLCGATCDWHYEEDSEGNRVREPQEWYSPRYTEGLIDEYIKELRGKW